MLFNSYAFIFAFLPVTIAVYFLIPKFGNRRGGGTHWHLMAIVRITRVLRILGHTICSSTARIHMLEFCDWTAYRKQAIQKETATHIWHYRKSSIAGVL